jgi:ABC-type Fe3+ transport system permease subunit
LVFISVIKEISATSILAGEHVQTLSYIAFLRYTEGDYTTGSAISVLMIAIALLGSGLITVWSRSGKTRAAS